MTENDKFEIKFHWTLAHSLLEIAREQLGEKNQLLSKLIAAIYQHTSDKVEEVSVSFSEDEIGQQVDQDFRKIVWCLKTRVKDLTDRFFLM